MPEADPEPDGGVRCLLIHLGTVFVGGSFSTIAGQPRANIAQLDASTGVASPWRGDTDGRVFSVAVWQRSLYVGGEFDHAGGQARNSLAALDLRTGSATAWDARLGPSRMYIAHGDYVWPYVEAVVVDHGTVYAGGWFSDAGGSHRVSVAAIDARTAHATAFDARLEGAGDVVTAIAVRRRTVSGHTVWAGGEFGRIAGESQAFLAALDDSTGRLLGAPPRLDGAVHGLLVSGDGVYAVGEFRSLNGFPRCGVALISALGSSALFAGGGVPAALHSPAAWLAPATPNPARESALLRFGLAHAGVADLTVYDLQGRRVANLLDREMLAAGEHAAQIRTDGWSPGCYVYRLEAGGLRLTRKLLVVR